jgi:hypothetical protein
MEPGISEPVSALEPFLLLMESLVVMRGLDPRIHLF